MGHNSVVKQFLRLYALLCASLSVLAIKGK